MARLEYMTSETGTLLYEESAAFAGWFKLMIVAILAVTFIPGIAIISSEPLAGWVMLGATAFDGLLFHWLLPHHFQLYPDRLRIVLGYPFSFNLPLGTIKEVQALSAGKTLVNFGLRMATAPSNGVEIRRSRGFDLVISPANRQLFLEQINGALRRK